MLNVNGFIEINIPVLFDCYNLIFNNRITLNVQILTSDHLFNFLETLAIFIQLLL